MDQWVHKVKIQGKKNMTDVQNEYTLTRKEFADKLGKSVGSVKQDMRRGKHKDLYIFDGKNYLFKEPRVSMNPVPGSNPSVVPSDKPGVVRKVRRGKHFEGKYPNRFMKAHNEKKILLKIYKGISESEAKEFINDYDKWKNDKKVEQQEAAKKYKTNYKNYGWGIYNCKTVEPSWTINYTNPKLPPKPKTYY